MIAAERRERAMFAACKRKKKNLAPSDRYARGPDFADSQPAAD